MELLEAIKERHAVRTYEDRPIAPDTASALFEQIARVNEESGLEIRLVTEEAEAFGGLKARYGSFRGVRNYLVLAGKEDPALDERCGYYGERLVLFARQLGLDSCWVVATYAKKKVPPVGHGSRLVCVVALGYGVTHGAPHKSKELQKLYRAQGEVPDWFLRGVETAALAPTALNQQRFLFTLEPGNRVRLDALSGMYTKIDKGIVKYHFEVGAAGADWRWAEE